MDDIRKRYLERKEIVEDVLTRPGTPKIKSIDANGHMFTPAGEEVCKAYLNKKR